MKDLRSNIEAMGSSQPYNIYSQRNLINERDKLFLRAESNLTAIDSYLDQLEERLAAFAVASRDIALRQ